MLSNIRLLADHIIVRILLGLIALSFIAWGIQGVLNGNNSYDLVTFKKIPNITEDEFAQKKAEQIAAIEKNNDSGLTAEEIKELKIDSIVLNQMITERIINYIASFYDLDISDELVVQTVKDYSIFKDDKGKFDINIFNTAFRSEHQREEYLNHTKENIIKNVILSTFLEGFKPPTILIKNIANYLAETRTIDLVSIDLFAPNKNLQISAPSNDDLAKFYKENIELFTVKEKREIEYIKLSFNSLLEKIKINEDEITDYYEQNSEQFKKKKLQVVKNQIELRLKVQRLENYVFEFIKSLEEEVASGATLQEIANKYQLLVHHLHALSYEEMLQDEALNRLAESTFEMSVDEVSYPIELQEQKQIILIELKKINPATQENFVHIRQKVLDAWSNNMIAKANLDNFRALSKSYDSSDQALTTLKEKPLKEKIPFKVEKVTVTRKEIQGELANSKLPQELSFLVFELSKTGNNTTVVRQNNKLYFAHLKSVNFNTENAKKIEKDSNLDIVTKIKNNLMEELIDYFIKATNMKIQNR